MKYKWIEDIQEFELIAEEWDRALMKSGEDNPFLHSVFLKIWWKYYGEHRVLRIFIVYMDGTIVGGIPLCGRKNGKWEYPGGMAANYTEFLAVEDSAVIWEIFLRALHLRNDWKTVQLARYRENSVSGIWNNVGDTIRVNGLIIDKSEKETSYYITVPESFSGYISSLPQKLRYYVRKSQKECGKLGNVALCTLSSCNEVIELTEKFIKMSVRAFSRRGNRSTLDSEHHALYFRDLIQNFCREGLLDICTLKLDKKILAMYIGYSLTNNLNYVFTTFNIDFAKYNPGHLLIYKLVGLASERGSKMIDLYSGHQLYKTQWADRTEKIYLIEIRKDTLICNLEHSVISIIKKSPAIKNILSYIYNSTKIIKSRNH